MKWALPVLWRVSIFDNSQMVFVVTSEPYLYHGESLELMTHRWTKLEKVGAMDDTVGWRYVFLGKHPEMEVMELL